MVPDIKGLREVISRWGVVVTLFRVLKKRKKIVSYSLGNLPFVSNFISFRVEIAEGQWINFKFFKTEKLTARCEVAEIRIHELSFLIGKCSLVQLYGLVLRQINDKETQVFGFGAEINFLQKTQEIFRQEFSDSVTIKKGTISEDKNGIDFWIDFKGDIIPLQLKTSRFYQGIHRVKYPGIPSLVYRREYSRGQLLRLLVKICTSYQKGKTEHL